MSLVDYGPNSYKVPLFEGRVGTDRVVQEAGRESAGMLQDDY